MSSSEEIAVAATIEDPKVKGLIIPGSTRKWKIFWPRKPQHFSSEDVEASEYVNGCDITVTIYLPSKTNQETDLLLKDLHKAERTFLKVLLHENNSYHDKLMLLIDRNREFTSHACVYYLTGNWTMRKLLQSENARRAGLKAMKQIWALTEMAKMLSAEPERGQLWQIEFILYALNKTVQLKASLIDPMFNNNESWSLIDASNELIKCANAMRPKDSASFGKVSFHHVYIDPP